MGQCFLTIDTMKIFVFLFLLSLVYSAPAPKDDTLEPRLEVVPYIHKEIEALPYEHDATGDVAEPYIHQEISEDAEDPEPAALVVPQPVAAFSYAPYAVTNYAALPKVAAGLISPFQLVASYKTGCVNSVGSVVPCHL